MALNAKDIKGNGFTLPNLEPGGYPARVAQVIDLGVQAQRPFKGEEKSPQQTIKVAYELVDEFMPDEDGNDNKEKPRWLHEEFPLYSLDSDRAKSTKRYLAIDPKMEYEGDWSQLVGKPVTVTVVNNESKGKVYDNVDSTSVMRDKEAAKLPELVNDPIVFDLDSATPEQFLRLSDYIQAKIKAGVEFENTNLHKLLQEHEEVKEDEVDMDNPRENADDWDD